MPKKVSQEMKDRAVRLVLEHQQDYPSRTAACVAVGKQMGLGRETVSRWVRQAVIDSGEKPGVTSAELEQIKKLQAENARLREDVAILKAATTFFVGELDSRKG